MHFFWILIIMYCFYLNSVEGEVMGSKNWRSKGLILKTPCKALLFYLTLNSKGIWMVRHSFLLCFLSSCLNSLFRLQFFCFLIVN